MKIRALTAALALTLTLSACGEDDPQTPPQSSPTTESPSPQTSYTELEFTAEDGEQRSARLFGSGNVAVVLSHMGRGGDDQDDWEQFAEDLAANGFQVLTYDGRQALSKSWNDVLGAVGHLRDGGAETVIVAGASIGAMASLQAAVQSGSEINAVLWLAGVLSNSGYHFTESDVSGLACPMLIASGDEDSYGAGEDAVRLHEWTSEVSELLIVESGLHGTEILLEEEPAVADELRQGMTDFLDRVAEAPATTC